MDIAKNTVLTAMLTMVMGLTACSGLTTSNKAATRTWWLEPLTGQKNPAAEAPPLPVTIAVSTVPGLDTDRILTLSRDAQLNHYEAARWADHLPELLTSLVARSLQASGRFEVVTARATGASQVCEVHMEVLEFFSRLGAEGSAYDVRIAVTGRSLCADREPVNFELDTSVPASEDRMSRIVAAFQTGLDDVMVQLLEVLED